MIRQTCLALAGADTGASCLEWMDVPLTDLEEWAALAVERGERQKKRMEQARNGKAL